jgi:hypothetical protein
VCRPDQDSLEMAWMENGDVENRSFEMQGVSAEDCNMHLVGVLEEDYVLQSPRMQQTVASFRDNQDSSPFVDFGCLELLDSNAIEREDESLDMNKPICAGSTAKRNRAAEVHNLSERRRRDRINEKMKSLQELIPNSNKTDKTSILDEVIGYIKTLQLQLQIMSIRSGRNLPPMLLPSEIQHLLRMPQMAMNMVVGMGMRIDLGIDMVHMCATGSGRGSRVSSSIQNTRSPVLWWFCVSLSMLTSRDWHLM